MIFFHEVLHITSNIVDHSYSSRQGLAWARTKPQVARRNTVNYTSFAKENGYTLKQYSKGRTIYSSKGKPDRSSICKKRVTKAQCEAPSSKYLKSCPGSCELLMNRKENLKLDKEIEADDRVNRKAEEALKMKWQKAAAIKNKEQAARDKKKTCWIRLPGGCKKALTEKTGSG